MPRRRARARKSGDLNEAILRDLDLAFLWLEVMLEVTAAEKPEYLICAGAERHRTWFGCYEPSQDAEIEVLADIGPNRVRVQLAFRVARIDANAEARAAHLQNCDEIEQGRGLLHGLAA
jgi:hypothetical protein